MIALVAAAVAQIGLASYRAALEQSTPVFGIIAGAFLLLPLLRYQERPLVRTICRGVGFAFFVLGIVLTYVAIASPVMGLVQRGAMPGFAFSFGALLVLDPSQRSRRVLAVVMFAISFVGGQLAMNHEAQHVRDLRTEGILHHWH